MQPARACRPKFRRNPSDLAVAERLVELPLPSSASPSCPYLGSTALADAPSCCPWAGSPQILRAAVTLAISCMGSSGASKDAAFSRHVSDFRALLLRRGGEGGVVHLTEASTAARSGV